MRRRPGRSSPEWCRSNIEARLEEVRRRQGEEAVTALRSRLENDDYRDELPYFSAGFVDREDRLWLGAFDWPDSRGPAMWSVFDPEGLIKRAALVVPYDERWPEAVRRLKRIRPGRMLSSLGSTL